MVATWVTRCGEAGDGRVVAGLAEMDRVAFPATAALGGVSGVGVIRGANPGSAGREVFVLPPGHLLSAVGSSVGGGVAQVRGCGAVDRACHHRRSPAPGCQAVALHAECRSCGTVGYRFDQRRGRCGRSTNVGGDWESTRDRPD